MEAKKTLRADLNQKKNLFSSIGFIVSLSLVITVFEWRSYDKADFSLLAADLDTEVEDVLEIPPTSQPPPPPPQLQAPVIVEVPDIEEIEDEIDVNLDVEITEETAIEEVIFSEAPEIKEETADEVFTIVETAPLPTGGYEAFYAEIARKLKYPTSAKRMGIEGKVYVQFIINRDGSMTDFSIVRGIGSGCDEEALRVMKSMPKWSPGKQRGRPVRVQMIIPIRFMLKE
jgi:protein TonB